MNGTETRSSDYQVPIESGKLVIELSNLGSGSIRTIKHELTALIENYAHEKMIKDNVKVTEGNKMGKECKHLKTQKNSITKWCLSRKMYLATGRDTCAFAWTKDRPDCIYYEAVI